MLLFRYISKSQTMEITIYSVLIWVVAVVIGSFSAAIFWGSKRYSSRAFAISIFFVALWTANMGFNIGARDEVLMYWVLKTSYVWGFIISWCFLYFCISYPEDRKPSRKLVYPIVATLLSLSTLTLLTDGIAGDPISIPGLKHFGWYNGPLWFLFAAVFSGFLFLGLIILLKKVRYANNLLEKRHLKIMFGSLLVGFIPPMLTDIVLPQFGYFALTWLGPMSGIIWVFIVSYAIVKYKQMNVRVVFGQAIIVAMLLLFFANIFTDFGFGVWGRIATFIVFALLGLFLLKNILVNQLQKEELADLNQNLQKRVDAQTKEIKRAYEVEKRARVELQQLNQNKNDFIIITQHHLRTPLAQIRWYTDSIATGLYGIVSDELGTVISHINGASEKLIKTLNNFLNIAQMKIGMKFLTIGPVDVQPIINAILFELSPHINKKHISVTVSGVNANWPLVRADAERIKEALAILIDNAVVYNTGGGNIAIEAEKQRNMFLLHISNTGLSLNSEESARLFKQSFFRTKEAKWVNPTGMGVGLLVVKTIIEAHKGSLALESSEGERTRFVISLPLGG